MNSIFTTALTSDQLADPLFVMTHDPANANRADVRAFLAAEQSMINAVLSKGPWSPLPASQQVAAAVAAGAFAVFPYKSAGSKLTDWEPFFTANNLSPSEPYLRNVFLLLLLGVS